MRWPRSGSESTTKTPAGSVNCSPRGAGQAGRRPARTGRRRRGCWPSTPTAIPVLQRAFLDALRREVTQGEASPAHLAYLEDRVRVGAGQPQLYGTQFTIIDGELGPCPIEDPQRLDDRRAAAGLKPFAAYESRMRDKL